MNCSAARSGGGVSRALGRIALVMAAVLGSTLVPAAPASAEVVAPLELTYNEAHYGDFIHIGNGVMVCPPGGVSRFTPALCQDGQDRQSTQALNDRYNMEWNDPDGGGPRFNGSSGELTIPPGASVAYAQLSWAGATGVLRDIGGQLHGPNTGDPACGSNQELTGGSATLPPGSPQDTSVFLSVDGGAAAAVAPATLVTGPTPTTSGAQYYSAHAEVTGQLASAPTGTSVTVEVADVWAPEGYNCFGGWSLTLVYSYPEPDPTHAPQLRRTYVYTGHVRQNPGDPATDTMVDGFVYGGGDIRLGTTAYEGNWGLTGDYFDVNGTRLAEPQIDVTDNFFISATDGSAAPDVPNNFSVDAKVMDVGQDQGLIPLDATSADLAFGTAGDAYMAQLLVFSVPLAELQVEKEVCHSADASNCGPGGPGRWEKSTAVPLGETAYWRITVTNPSSLDITDATLDDNAEPSCAEAAGSFDVAAGESVAFYCATEDLTEPISNAVTTSFVPPGAPPGTEPTVSPPSEARADPYGMAVSKQVCRSPEADDCGPGGAGPWAASGSLRAGATAYWRITVVNNGTLPLTGVVLEDQVEPACAEAAGQFDLAPGQTRRFFCQTPDMTPPLVNAVAVLAAPPPEAPPDAPEMVVAAAEAAALSLADTGSSAIVPLAAGGLGLIVAGAVILVLAWGLPVIAPMIGRLRR